MNPFATVWERKSDGEERMSNDDTVNLQDWVGRTSTVEEVASGERASRLASLLGRQGDETDPLFPLGHWLHFSEDDVPMSELGTEGHVRLGGFVRAGELPRRLGAGREPAVPAPTPPGLWLPFSEDDVPMSELGTDGHVRLGGFMPPVDLPRRMWAGSELTFHAPILPGQLLSRTTTIESVTEKSGSTGPLCFVVLRHEISADGKLTTTDRHTIVYREAASAPEGSAARAPREDSPVPAGWDWSKSVRPDEVMLFRYSALTFNSHRIHYDYPYV